jgi:hypothetical protein
MPAGPDGYVGSHQFPGGSQAKGKEVKEKNKVPLQAKKLARAIARGFQARHHLGKVQYDAVVVIMAKAAKEMHGRVSTNNRSAASGPRSMGRVGLTPHARELLATDPVIVSAMSGPNPLMKAGKKHVPFSEADKRGEMTSQHELFLFEWDAYAAGDFESFCWFVCNLLGQNGRRTVGEVSKCGGLWWVVWVQWWVVWVHSCWLWWEAWWCGSDDQGFMVVGGVVWCWMDSCDASEGGSEWCKAGESDQVLCVVILTPSRPRSPTFSVPLASQGARRAPRSVRLCCPRAGNGSTWSPRFRRG